LKEKKAGRGIFVFYWVERGYKNNE